MFKNLIICILITICSLDGSAESRKKSVGLHAKVATISDYTYSYTDALKFLNQGIEQTYQWTGKSQTSAMPIIGINFFFPFLRIGDFLLATIWALPSLNINLMYQLITEKKPNGPNSLNTITHYSAMLFIMIYYQNTNYLLAETFQTLNVSMIKGNEWFCRCIKLWFKLSFLKKHNNVNSVQPNFL